MKKISYRIKPILFALLILCLCGWGSTGHKIINTEATYLFKGKTEPLSHLSGTIITNSSAADSRKNSDPTEAPKHYIDIEKYPEFLSTGRISMYYDSVVALHGENFVIDTGTLPWTILATFDSLKAAFSRNDWTRAGLVAADLGHYVGDSHMPLHLTENYNGYQTNQSGVHSRYETSLINTYSSQIKYDLDCLRYIKDVRSFVFTYLYGNYKYVDSVLNADKQATSFAGTNKGTAYLQKFWELAGTFTDTLFKNASCRLADLIFTAWVDAGSPVYGVSNTSNKSSTPKVFMLGQNYPNPFNPVTKIRYAIANVGTHGDASVHLEVYDILGREIAVLVNRIQRPGNYEVTFDGSRLASGVYFYKFEVGDFSQTKSFVLLK